MPIATANHITNPNANAEGGKSPCKFNLTLSRLSAKSTYELLITLKIVVDFDENAKTLPKVTHSQKYRESWAQQLKQLIQKKWSGFRLVDRRSSAFFVRVNIDCQIQTPESKTSNYHIWIHVNPNFSFMRSPQPSFYSGIVWYLRPDDIEPLGNAAHEFGHMIGIVHTNQGGTRLMYGNDKYKKAEVTPQIKNETGYIYPEIDLNFHRDWVVQELKKKGLLPDVEQLYFEPSRRK